jgi:hypothetical protein
MAGRDRFAGASMLALAALFARAGAVIINVPGGGTLDLPDSQYIKIVDDGTTDLHLSTVGTTVEGPASAGIGVPFLSTSAGASGVKFSGAEADVFVSFAWIGPQGAVGSLPVNITTNLHAAVGFTPGDANAGPAARARLEVHNPVFTSGWTDPIIERQCQAPSAVLECDDGTNATPNGDFSGSLHMNLTPDHVYTMELLASASGIGDANWSAVATVDPLIFLDPGYDNLGGYSLYLSEGIQNGIVPPNGEPGGGPPSDVPEPSSLLLIGGALAGWGAARRRSGNGKAH